MESANILKKILQDKKPLIVVDFSNFVHTCWWPAVAAEKADPKYVALDVLITNIKGKLGTIISDLALRGIEDANWLFVEDRVPKRKLEAFPLYKSNRDRDPAAIDPRPAAKAWLVANGYTQFCHSPDNEADDAIATVVAQTDIPAVIVSSDKDLWQLYSENCNVDIYRTTVGKFVTADMIKEEFGIIHARQIPIHKALWGDTSDAIPNVMPRMQKQLLPLINDNDRYCLDLKDLEYAMSCAKVSDRCRQLWIEGIEQVRLNYSIVKLQMDVPLVFEGE